MQGAEKEDALKPYSSKIKLVIEFDEQKKKYEMSENDKKVLAEYGISY